jgi:hypothetical protein
MKQFWLFFSVQCLQYFLITVNYRAVSQGLYGWTFVSDMAVAFNGFLLIKRISDDKGRAGLAGYTLGGAVGSVMAIFITKRLFGE